MFKYFKGIFLIVLPALFVSEGFTAQSAAKNSERLSLDIISYEDFVKEDPKALALLKEALYVKGIAGIRGIPGYREKVVQFIETAREFTALPEEIKEGYAPNHSLGEIFLGYERGKEKFKRLDGSWMIDDLKVSYYANVPDSSLNKWPREVDLKTPFQELGAVMSEMGKKVMDKIGLLGPSTGIFLDGVPRVGRMLYYSKSGDSEGDNPFWCGAHFDHSLFTALVPAFYFIDDKEIAEPMEAGLFVKTSHAGMFQKVIADDPDVLMFQVGEFGQLITNDAIRATEHRVSKPALKAIERYTMALFFSPPMESVISSTSELTRDSRYGSEATCSFRHWHEESFKRYIVKEDSE
jgi:isopenicillin N synthase-like dioxygenase